jgi:ATP-dependent HslUV protease ATP-binding subunit HslU
LLEEISFGAADKSGESVRVNAVYVDEHVGELAKDEDLSRYIL